MNDYSIDSDGYLVTADPQHGQKIRVRRATLKDIQKYGKDSQQRGKLVFRYVREAWIGSEGDINVRERFRPVWRLSRQDEGTSYLLEDLNERLNAYVNGWGSNPLSARKYKVDQLYQLEVTNISTDWETGIVDDWDVEFVPYKED